MTWNWAGQINVFALGSRCQQEGPIDAAMPMHSVLTSGLDETHRVENCHAADTDPPGELM